MKLTLATCALGALGLTPALQGAIGDPVAPAPPAPVLPPVLGLASTPLAPVAPAAPLGTLLRQDGQRGLEQDAARLKEEIARLRKELAGMQREMKNAGRQERNQRAERQEEAPRAEDRSRVRLMRPDARGEAERRIDELRLRENEQRARMDEQRARMDERRARAEEMREMEMGRRQEAMERAHEARERAEEIREEAREQAEDARARSKDALKVWTKKVEGRKKKDPATTFEWKTGDGEEIETMILRLQGEADGDTEHVIERFIGKGIGGKNGKKPQVFQFRSGGPGSGPSPGASPFGSGGPGRGIHAGGPNTFNIHVEDGDVHIHTTGGSSITTSKGKAFSGSAEEGFKADVENVFFGSQPPHPPQPGKPHKAEAHGVHVFGRAEMKNGKKPMFSVNINGKDLELSELEGFFAANSGEEGESPIGLVLGELADVDFGSIGGLIELENLEALEALEDLEGIIEMEIDVDLDDMPNMGEVMKKLRISFPGSDGNDEECVEEVEEVHEQIEEIHEEAPRDERFVVNRVFHAPDFPARTFQALASAPEVEYSLATNFAPSAPAAAASAENELLDLARQIQADVRAMRAELDELRAEVLGAPRRQ